MMAESIMTRMRDETSEQHKHAESRPLEIALVKGEISRTAYVQYLEQRVLVHRVLEDAVMALAAADARLAEIDFEPLLQVPNLEADLRHLDGDLDPAPLPETTAFLNELKAAGAATPAAWLGTYYVFEGSKNGARFISRAIRKSFDLGEDGVRYLDPHGEQQRPLWLAFKQQIDAIGFSPAEEDAMVAAARRAFDGVSAVDDAIGRTLENPEKVG